MRASGRKRVVGVFAAVAATLAVAIASWIAPGGADAPNVVSGQGVTVSGWRWISTRTLEVDISTTSVAANAVNGPHRVRVTLPANYFQQATDRFPVLYLLHGGAGGNSAQWTTGGGDAENITRNASLITVMPDGGKVGWYTNWVDQSQGAQNWATFHLNQLIAWVDANFRTIAAKSGRAIAGLSMGGFGAIRYAQDRPDLFAYAASFSGALDLNDSRIRGTVMEQSGQSGFSPYGAFGNPFPPLDAGWRSLDPVTRASRLQGVGVALYAGSGINDYDQIERTVMDATKKMHDALTAAGVPHFYWMYGRPGPSVPYGCDGGHDFSCWNFAFNDALPRIMAALQSPAPPPADLITNGGFESASSAPWMCSGQCGIDRGAGLAHSGSNNGWVRNASGWNDIHQTISVSPNTNYSVTAWVRTSANNGAGALGLRAAGGAVVGQQTFAVLGSYSFLSVTVNSGANSSLDFFAGLTANGDTWLQIDDVSVLPA